MRPGPDLRKRMFTLDHAMKSVQPPRGLGELHAALSRGTSHAPQRRVRHDHFFALLTQSEGDWRARWETLIETTG